MKVCMEYLVSPLPPLDVKRDIAEGWTPPEYVIQILRDTTTVVSGISQQSASQWLQKIIVASQIAHPPLDSESAPLHTNQVVAINAHEGT
ncbi:hypothetical protein J6590_086651 [Homalodisca vitripennis]|nr:hypothetical protein J6590_086651 [Homalodisca vitripennis]